MTAGFLPLLSFSIIPAPAVPVAGELPDAAPVVAPAALAPAALAPAAAGPVPPAPPE